MKIDRVQAREILDSRGRPTVEVEVYLEEGTVGAGIAPSGVSTGSREAVELRDRDPSRYQGWGVLRAVRNVVELIGPLLHGMEACDQEKIDLRMREADGTPTRSRLGANAIVATSMACCNAAAAALKRPLWQHLAQLSACSPQLPMPMVNIISGGLHAGKQLEFQDFLVIPIGARTYSRALEILSDVYSSTFRLLQKQGYGALVADEGGFGPALQSNEEAVRLLAEAIHACGYDQSEVRIALDVASTRFYSQDRYRLAERGELDREAMIDFLVDLSKRYPILSIEDGLEEKDWEGWRQLTQRLQDRIQLLGDDFFVTSPDLVRRGIQESCGNAVLIKLNQIGTVSETLETMRIAQESGFNTVVSARSGETEDTFISDLAVGAGAGQIKIGSLARSERLAKYNRLLRIQETLGPASFAGRTAFERFLSRQPSS